MIQSIQKIIKIGSSGGVTIPAKELKRQNINFGDEGEVIVRALRSSNEQDQHVLSEARAILKTYQHDFENLAQK